MNKALVDLFMKARDPDAKCPACNGNDANAPCAYPSKKMKGCLRDKRLLDEFYRDMGL